ncbi:MAG: hypothetical protein ACRED8_03175 [Caulobacteraceae bacterium]
MIAADYHERAAVAEALALRAPDAATRDGYLEIAAAWRSLARFTEQQQARRPEEDRSFHDRRSGRAPMPK